MEPSNLQSCLYLCWKYHNHAQSFVLPWLDDWTETLLLSSSFVSRTRQLSIQLDRIAHSKVLLYVQLFKVLISYYWFASLELPSMPPLSKRERTGVHQGHIFRAQSQGRIPQGLPSFHGKYSFIFCTGHATNPHGDVGREISNVWPLWREEKKESKTTLCLLVMFCRINLKL